MFLKGVEMEKSGKLYEAIQFYRRAVQLVPDIEFKLHDASKAKQKEVTHANDGLRGTCITTWFVTWVIDFVFSPKTTYKKTFMQKVVMKTRQMMKSKMTFSRISRRNWVKAAYFVHHNLNNG